MRGHRALAVLGAVLLAAGLGSAPAAAQDGTAGLAVTVKDNYGVIPGAAVRVAAKAGGAARRGNTDSAGAIRVDGLAGGDYVVRASLLGFADVEQTVTLANGEQKAVELILRQAQFSDTVTVTTANRREQLLLDVAEPTTLIDEAQILDSGARSAKDLLVQMSGAGVQVNAGGGQGHMSINGIPNSGVLVLVDGRRFLGRDANGNFNMEELAMSGMERVEIVKGPGSALYGADALGGVVNFVTKKAKDPGFKNNLALLGGSYGDWRVNDSVTYRGDKGAITAYGSWRTYDGFDLDEKNPQTIGQPASKFWNAGLSADYRFSDKLIGRIFADYNDRHIDPYYFSGATQLASTVYNSIRDLTRVMISPELEILASSKTSFNISYNYGDYDRDETQVFVVGGRVAPQPNWNEGNNELKITGRHAFTVAGQDHPLQAGYEYRKENLSRGSLNVQDPERKINVFWAQQEINLGSRVTLTGGFRYDDYDDFGSRWSPKASAVVALAENHRLRGTFGEGFRPPYFGELYLSTPPFFVGNPDLKPVETQGYTVGYAYSSRKAYLSADWFDTELTNNIVFDLRRLPFTYTNLGTYNSRGINSSVGLNLPYGFSPSVDYTYNERKNQAGQEIGGYPKHSVMAKLLWASPKLGVRANVRAEFNGEIPPGPTDTSVQPAYNVYYAQVSKSFARKGAYGFNVWAQVSNLADERDIYRQDLNGNPLVAQTVQVWIAPRTFQGGITIDMDWTR
ncbi:MAG: TonB-dependent receptor [Vicinamibacteria bacterium]